MLWRLLKFYFIQEIYCCAVRYNAGADNLYMLKNVKLLVLIDKTINLPFQKKLMHRLLLVSLLSIMLFAGCKKDTGSVSSRTAIAAQAAIDDKIITNYIAANHLANFRSAFKSKDSTGLYYRLDDSSATATLYSSSTLVTVGYTGRVLPADTVFTQTANIYPSFTLGEMIRGWSLCIPQCNKGGTIRILMASRFAYGPYPQPNANLPKANSVLDFTITLYDVTN